MRAIILITCALLTACETFDPQEHAYQNVKSLGEPVDIITSNDLEPVDLRKLLSLDVTTERERNRQQSILLARSQSQCAEFISRLHYTRASMNTSLSTYSNITSTAAAIVSGRAGQNLAGMSSVFGFYNNTVNQEFYGGLLMPAITEEIFTSRSEAYSEIIELQKKSLTEYPNPMAILDAIKYHDMCSVPYALVGLTNQAADQKYINDSTSAIASIDNEINKQKELLSSNLGLSKPQQNELKKNIMELTKRREILSISTPQKPDNAPAKPISSTAPAEPNQP